MSRKFSSKVLVFGEYAVVQGGEALAIPNPVFKAHLDYGHAELEVFPKEQLF